MQKIRYIYFDIGNVLLLFSGGLQKLAKKYDRKYSDVERIFLKYDDSICRGKMTTEDLWAKYQAGLYIKDDQLDFAEFWANNFVLIHETFDLIEEIHGQDIKIGLLSNIYPVIFNKLADRNFLPHTNWQSKVLSCDVGFVKPERKIYEIAEDKAGVNPKEILFVDDKKDFLLPAKDRGWQVFQFNQLKITESVQLLRKLLVDKKVLK